MKTNPIARELGLCVFCGDRATVLALVGPTAHTPTCSSEYCRDAAAARNERSKP